MTMRVYAPAAASVPRRNLRLSTAYKRFLQRETLVLSMICTI